MTVTDHAGLDALCDACGIANGYHDIAGELHQPDIEVRRLLLEAIGYPVDDDVDIQRHLATLSSREWRRIVSPVMVYRPHDVPRRLRLSLTPAQCAAPVRWELLEESGQRRQGSWEFDSEQAIGEYWLNEMAIRQFEAELPDVDDFGYHQLRVETGGGVEATSLVIVAPGACYEPPVLANQKKAWGVSLQLYSLRSRRNWGIGDFGDLRSAIDILAPLGVDVIGLNPLHTLFAHQPEKASPYSPSSRDHLNPVYLDIEAIEDYSECQPAQALVVSDGFQASLQTLRDAEFIDYTGVWAAKLQVLEMLYQGFRRAHLEPGSSRAAEFRQFQRDGGQDLFRFALFEALQRHFHAADAGCTRWQQWPRDYQDPDSNQTTTWAEQNLQAIEFHQYLQWITELQLAVVADCCRHNGMGIGIYRDLAVGNEQSAAQCWAEPELYAPGIGIGAPPDDFSSNGQNWELPPLKPPSVSPHFYHRFARTLRANMRHAGALRIDHIMGLMRLYWIPLDDTPGLGSYVSYPFQDLLAIVALESQRNRCLVVGEDLGTVPDEVRYALEPNNILSYRILRFEKDWHHGRFIAPTDYPRYALCVAGSHDLPTLSAYWQELDIDLRDRLKQFASPELAKRQRQLRAQERSEILAALERENLVPGEALADAGTAQAPGSELVLSIHRFLARSNAAVMMVQIEDLFGQQQQVNLPGTIDEYPNWRCKLPVDLEDWPARSELESVTRAIDHERHA
jgi:(1->4)-alpha-D-glucan 1-alpha-D-glucosylmutase